MRRALFLLLGACSFDARLADGQLPGPEGDGAPDAPMIDAALDGAPPPPLCDPADLDLRACFTFDDTLADGSSYGNTITASIAPTYVAGHAGGKAVVTTSGTFTTPSSTSLNITTFTFRMWIKPTTIPTGGARMGLLDSGNRYRLFLQSDGALRCAVTNGADLTSATNKVVANKWQRVACRYNGATMTIYVDGAMVATSNQTSTVQSVSNGMVVGHNNPSGENFDGALDDLQVYGSLVAP